MSEKAPHSPAASTDFKGAAAPRRIGIIGGGISGLAAAHRLTELDPELQIQLFESRDRLGGVLFTEQSDEFLLEHSADNFITNQPWALELCRRVGLSNEVLHTQPSERRAFVVRSGSLHPVPEGFLLMAPARLGAMLRTQILSPRAKLRLLLEPFIPRRRDGDDENLESFAVRRLGQEAFDRLVQPLIGGIYTADPTKLSVAATMPQFLEMEKRHGSLYLGARRQAHRRSNEKDRSSGARYGLFVAPREGVSQLVEAIASRLPADTLKLNSRALKIVRRTSGGYDLEVQSGGGQPETCHFDALIVAVPAPRAAQLLDGINQRLTAQLETIQYAGTAIVIAGYAREQITRPLKGFGFVVPEIERRRILACSYASAKYPSRAPEGHVLLRTFLGGACHPEMLDLDDDTLAIIAAEELGDLLGIRGTPVVQRVARWDASMPQYHVGHLERVAKIEALIHEHPGLELAGNAYRGVGIPFCVHSGERAAERILSRTKADP